MRGDVLGIKNLILETLGMTPSPDGTDLGKWLHLAKLQFPHL